MQKLPKPSFTEYKSMKDEIIKISEQRFEVILGRKFDEFRNEIKNDIGAIRKEIRDSKNDVLAIVNPRFDNYDRMFKMVFWILGFMVTLYIASYSVMINILLSIAR